VLVTDINGCSLSLPVTLTAPTVLETELNVGIFNGGTNVSCEGAEDGSIALVISGGTGQVSVMWEGPDGFSSAQDTLTDLSAGNYCVTLTDANDCSTVACQMLIAPSTLVVGGTATPAACGLANGAVDASITGGTGPYDLVWNNGATDEDLSSIAPGTYSVDVTDANGCTANTTVIVIGTAALQAVISANDVRCHQANDGTIVVTPITGEAPYSYDWDHGPNTASVSDLAPGSYTVLITDANGCSLSTSASIAEPTAIDAVGEVSTYDNGYSVSTYLGTDGSITTAVSGGSGPYEYAWAHGPSTADVNGLSAGTYVVTITDVNGCSIQLEFVLDEPNDLGQPTGFTPNGDGQNDRYHVRGLDAFDTNQMTVFNRWGNVVYERVNYRNDWTGENMTGEPLPNGTYFVIITIPDAGQTLQNYVDLRR
jgi:gliding motility-associated-like protein